MKVSHIWLQTYFDKPIPAAEKLAELFTFHSFEVEGMESDVLDVKILPDRAHYCLSHLGVAEEISVLTGLPLSLKKKDVPDVPVSIDRHPVVTIEDHDFCRRFTGRFVKNISTMQSSPATASATAIASALTAIGQRSISPIVDSTNFVMFDVGQPTHAFDADKIVGDIVIRKAHTDEKVTLLDGKEYTLTAEDHVIADSVGALDIAGVKGGKRAEVTAETRTILLTSANFDPTAVRRTSTRLNLRNEASKRFENEITPELAMEGMRQLSSLLLKAGQTATGQQEEQQVGQQKVQFGPIVDEYPVKAVQTVITLDPAYVSDRLGVTIPDETIKDIICRMGITITEKKKAVWSLTIPFRRLDLTIAEDIVEEVGRIYGYEHIVGTLPATSTHPISTAEPSSSSSSPAFYYAEKIKDILVEAGFSEVYLYTLAPKGDIEVSYPLTKDKAALRTNLTSSLGACLEMNVKNADLLGLEAVKIFEIGKVFTKAGSTCDESLVLALAAAQVKKVKGVDGKFLVNDVLKKISAALGCELPIKSLLSSGKSAVCEIPLKPLKSDSGFFRADSHFASSLATKISYKPFSLYPFIVRDIAVFVPEVLTTSTSASAAADVWTEIEKGVADAKAEDILVRHSLFDTFKKDGKISYAFRLIFQSMSRTLTDTEANAVMDTIYAQMAQRGWQVR
jgi:phenylalanyl-tRNA synthetase beta subunit